MRVRSWIMAAGAMLALAAGCAQKEVAPAVDLAAEEKAVRDASAAWMKLAQSKDAAAIVDTVYLPEAVTVFNGELRTGSAEIQAGMDKEFSEAPASTLVWTTASVKLASSGDMAWETGAFTFDPDGEGEKPAHTGNFVTVWSKVNGAWRVAADSGSAAHEHPADEAATSDAAKPAAG